MTNDQNEYLRNWVFRANENRVEASSLSKVFAGLATIKTGTVNG